MLKKLLPLILCAWMFVGCTQNSTTKDSGSVQSTAQAATEPVDTAFVKYWMNTLYPNDVDTAYIKVTKARHEDISQYVHLWQMKVIRKEMAKVKEGGRSMYGNDMATLTIKYNEELEKHLEGVEMDGMFYEATLPNGRTFQLVVDSTKCLQGYRELGME